jgi:DNA mismatch endonuclease, patch repair protein
MMSGIRNRNTKPEIRLRRALHALGFRFRLHAKGLPGKPDIVLRKHNAVIFVHGCFWHRHSNCRLATIPVSNADFWSEKFSRNVERDKANLEALALAGWRVGIIWECGVRPKDITLIVNQLKRWLLSSDSTIVLPF